jgi:hypothetical protein
MENGAMTTAIEPQFEAGGRALKAVARAQAQRTSLTSLTKLLATSLLARLFLHRLPLLFRFRLGDGLGGISAGQGGIFRTTNFVALGFVGLFVARCGIFRSSLRKVFSSTPNAFAMARFETFGCSLLTRVVTRIALRARKPKGSTDSAIRRTGKGTQTQMEL